VPVEASKVFFCNSRSEANDTQIKLVWYMNSALGRPRRKKIISRIKAYHGGTIAAVTYSGHPVAAAVALKTLEIYARDRVGEAVAHKSPHFLARLSALSQHPLVGEARGLGLVGALELVADKGSKRQFEPRAGIGPRVIQFAEEEGLMVRSLAGDIVSLCPPLIISVAEIDLLFERLGRSLDRTLDWAKQQRLIP